MDDPAMAPQAQVDTARERPVPEYRLHPKAVQLARWRSMLSVGLLCLPATVLGLALVGWLALPLVLLLALLAIALLGRYHAAAAARFRCRLLDDGLLVERGVHWRAETFVPRARVQHTEVDQGPIARRYGIATLKVYTAGSQVGVIPIAGLAHAHALALRDQLLGRDGRDGS